MRLAKLVASSGLAFLCTAEKVVLLESGKLKWTIESAYVDPTDSDFAIFKMIVPQGDYWFGLGLGTTKMSMGSDMIQFDGLLK